VDFDMALNGRMAGLWIAALWAPAALGADPALVGSTAADFLKLGAGARASALGEAVTADPSGLSDQAYNPAALGLGKEDGGGLELAHTEWYQGVMLDGASARLGLGAWGGLGLSYNYLSLPSQQETVATSGNTWSALGDFSPSDTVASLGYGVSFGNRLSLGGSLKSTAESLADHSSNGFGTDVGLLLRTPLPNGSAVTVGLADLNEGATQYSDGLSTVWPHTTNVGLAYSSPAGSKIRGTLAVDYDLPSDNQAVIGAGLELAWGDIFTPRFGYRRDNIFNPWSVGVGIRALRDLNLDLAVAPAGSLGTTYRAALSYQWAWLGDAPAAAQALTRPSGVTLKMQQAAFAPDEGLGKGRLRPQLPAGMQCKAWGLYIYDGQKVARTMQATGQPPEEIDWDGKRDNGAAAVPGVYPARLALRLVPSGTVYSDGYVNFQIYQAFPSLTLSWDDRSVLKNSKSKLVPAILDVKSGALDKNLAWRLTVLDPDGQPFRTFDGVLSPSAEVVWDGKADDGRDFYSNYHYSFKLDLTDKLGNVLKAEDTLKARMVFDR
jgi:X-X-X-Leu-X-X-Gly heptad repeat protein